jgi:hypothetical protein
MKMAAKICCLVRETGGSRSVEEAGTHGAAAPKADRRPKNIFDLADEFRRKKRSFKQMADEQKKGLENSSSAPRAVQGRDRH